MQNVHSGPDGDPWAKNSSEDGIPYYVSGDGADTSWDHPMLGRILSMLEDCNRIEYAAYRAATKLRIIQKRLNWDALTVYPVASILQHHALKPGEADTLITIGKVSAVISDIFAYIAWIGAQSNGFSFDLCADLTLNLFINIFDKKRRGQVRVLSVQTFLCLLCKDRPQGKLRYLFRQVSDHNNCCSRVKLATVLKEMCYIMEYLDEGWKFGLHTVGPAVDSCFSSMCPRQPSLSGMGVGPMRRQICFGLTEEKYLQWMAQHPQSLVWLFINHRLADSELVVHNVQCRACRQTPIVGLCYVCLQCWNVQLCQTCFLLSNPVPGHKKSHQMEEHCAQLTYSERFSVAVNRLLSVMRLSRPCVKKGPSFLPLSPSPQVPGDLIPVLARSEDEASSRDGNPSPLPPPPPPPQGGRPGSPGSCGDRNRNGRGSASGAYAVGVLAPSCSSRSSGVVVDPDLEARTPTSGNWFCQSPNLPPSASSSAASTHSSASPPLPLQIPAPGEDRNTNMEKREEPNLGRRKSINLHILPVHQQELQSILWHFEEEQKQLKSVLGNLESKTVDGSGGEAKQELQMCSKELEAQLSRLRSVLKNYMRFSLPATSLADGNGNSTSSGNGDENVAGNDAEREYGPHSPRLAVGSSYLPYPAASVAHDEPPRSEDRRMPRYAPLESTAVSTPVERGAMPYSPIGQSADVNRLTSEGDKSCSPVAPQAGKVVFRAKKLPASLQMRPGGPNDHVFNARPRGPDAFFGLPLQPEHGDVHKLMNGLAVDDRRAPIAEQETLGSFTVPSCQPQSAGKQNNLGGAQFPAVSLGDISSHLLSITQDLDIPRGSPAYLPYDQQAKRVSMINRELEGILRELDAVYPSMKPVATEESNF